MSGKRIEIEVFAKNRECLGTPEMEYRAIIEAPRTGMDRTNENQLLAPVNRLYPGFDELIASVVFVKVKGNERLFESRKITDPG